MNANTDQEPIELPSPETLLVPAQGWLTRASEFVVDSAEASALAQQMRATVNTEMKRLDAERREITKPMDDAKARVIALYDRPLAVLKNALEQYGAKVLTFNREQERIRVAHQKQLDDIAAKERARLQAQAAKASDKGQDDKAEALISTAAAVVAPIARNDAPKIAGTTIRKSWKFRVKNAAKVNPQFLIPDEIKIGKTVRAMGLEAQQLVGDGVEIFVEESLAQRS